MSVQIKVPTLGESVTEATVAKWFKQVGEQVEADEPIVELETDKVTLELNAPASGSLSEIVVEEGGEVEVGAVLGSIEEGEGAPAAKPAPARQEPQAEARPRAGAADGEAAAAEEEEERRGDGALSPAVRKLLDEAGIDPAEITPSGPKGNITKGDVLAAIEARQQAGGREAQREAAPEREAPVTRGRPEAAPEPAREAQGERAAERPAPAPERRAPARPEAPAGREERVKMTRLRRRIAERLKEAQNTAAILTTYNEADMSAVMALRSRYRDGFEKKHGVRLGFMSFFVKASINALQAFPAVNAEIDGDEVVYKHHYDIGVAVSTPSGLVVPVVRDADVRGFAELEKEINDLGLRARDGKLAMEELTGGTFTISNGGVYGSLMSAPILNPPQVGILGMHKIQERPVVVGGEITIRPMMYLALSYDHRIVDGREAVSFLVRVKECIEDPERLLLDI
jgi:2-oxoglutarate dehydrogenase E2 component (dihydrolipoamide succinyltransferase)